MLKAEPDIKLCFQKFLYILNGLRCCNAASVQPFKPIIHADTALTAKHRILFLQRG